MSARKYWLGFNAVSGVGPVRVRALLLLFYLHPFVDGVGGGRQPQHTLQRLQHAMAARSDQVDLDALPGIEHAVFCFDVLLHEFDKTHPIAYEDGKALAGAHMKL